MHLPLANRRFQMILMLTLTLAEIGGFLGEQILILFSNTTVKMTRINLKNCLKSQNHWNTRAQAYPGYSNERQLCVQWIIPAFYYNNA